MPNGAEGEDAPRLDDEDSGRIGRWLRIADELLRRNGGRKGGERDERSQQPGSTTPDDGRSG